MNEDFSVTLYKPYSTLQENATIHLPCLFPPDIEDYEPENFQELIDDCGYHIFKATITADPLTNPNDCMVVVIFSEFRELAFIRPTKDKTWTKIDLDDELISFDISDPYKSKFTWVGTQEPFTPTIKPYLLKSYEGDILQVIRYHKWDEDCTIRVTKEVKSFQIGF